MITREEVLDINEMIKTEVHRLKLNLNANKENYYARPTLRDMISELNSMRDRLSFNWNVANGETNFTVLPEVKAEAEQKVNDLVKIIKCMIK